MADVRTVVYVLEVHEIPIFNALKAIPIEDFCVEDFADLLADPDDSDENEGIIINNIFIGILYAAI